MRIVLEPTLCIGNAYQLQQFPCPLLCGRLVHAHMLAQRLHDLVSDGEHRVQRGHRVLEDEADAGAPDGTQLLVCAAQQVETLEQHRFTADHGRWTGQQAKQRHHRDRLAGSAFTHNAEQLPRLEIETHGVDGMYVARAGFESGIESRHLKHRRRAFRQFGQLRSSGDSASPWKGAAG